MAVYDDYLASQFQNYFSNDFLLNYLRPMVAIPTKNTVAAIPWHRMPGNLRRMAGAAKGHTAHRNTLIYDLDRKHGTSQVLQLMLEVEARNENGYYQTHPLGATTLDTYSLQTALFLNHTQLLHRRFRYGVAWTNDRFIMSQFRGPIEINGNAGNLGGRSGASGLPYVSAGDVLG